VVAVAHPQALRVLQARETLVAAGSATLVAAAVEQGPMEATTKATITQEMEGQEFPPLSQALLVFTLLAVVVVFGLVMAILELAEALSEVTEASLTSLKLQLMEL
jgi:F0F1-type ATP synthase membrane subunit c/vacuolar-type H+-ATPase subunit K